MSSGSFHGFVASSYLSIKFQERLIFPRWLAGLCLLYELVLGTRTEYTASVGKGFLTCFGQSVEAVGATPVAIVQLH